MLNSARGEYGKASQRKRKGRTCSFQSYRVDSSKKLATPQVAVQLLVNQDTPYLLGMKFKMAPSYGDKILKIESYVIAVVRK